MYSVSSLLHSVETWSTSKTSDQRPCLVNLIQQDLPVLSRRQVLLGIGMATLVAPKDGIPAKPCTAVCFSPSRVEGSFLVVPSF